MRPSDQTGFVFLKPVPPWCGMVSPLLPKCATYGWDLWSLPGTLDNAEDFIRSAQATSPLVKQ